MSVDALIKDKNIPEDENVLVWDGFIRFFHWSLLLSFACAYVTAEFGYDEIHSWLGYYITILLLARIAWGFKGSEHAKFTNFIYSVEDIYLYFVSIIKHTPERHLGHNPLGAVMVFVLLWVLLATVSTGLIYLTWGEFEGPLWAMGIVFQDGVGEIAHLIHYILPEMMLFFIFLHVLGVIVACWQHRENLVASMWHGYKKKHDLHKGMMWE